MKRYSMENIGVRDDQWVMSEDPDGDYVKYEAQTWTGCTFVGDPPAAYKSWREFCEAPIKQGARISAVSEALPIESPDDFLFGWGGKELPPSFHGYAWRLYKAYKQQFAAGDCGNGKEP